MGKAYLFLGSEFFRSKSVLLARTKDVNCPHRAWSGCRGVILSGALPSILLARAGEVLLQGHRHGPQQHLAPDEARLSCHLLDPLHDLLPHTGYPHVGGGLHFPQCIHQAPLLKAREKQRSSRACRHRPHSIDNAQLLLQGHTHLHPVCGTCCWLCSTAVPPLFAN